MKLLGIIFILLMGSCVSSYPSFNFTMNEPTKSSTQIIPVFIDASFSSADDKLIEEGIDQWNYVLNGQIKLEIISERFMMEPSIITGIHRSGIGLIIMPVTSACPFIPTSPLPNNYVLAWTNDIGGNEIYLIKERINGEELRGVLLHEIGHAMGAYHSSNPKSLMHLPYDDNQSCVDKETAFAIGRAHHLELDKLNYCY